MLCIGCIKTSNGIAAGRPETDPAPGDGTVRRNPAAPNLPAAARAGKPFQRPRFRSRRTVFGGRAVIEITLCALIGTSEPWRWTKSGNGNTILSLASRSAEPRVYSGCAGRPRAWSRAGGSRKGEKDHLFLCGQTPQNVQRICNRLNALEGGSHGSRTEARLEQTLHHPLCL